MLTNPPKLTASISESSLYQILGVGFTDPIFLIGHADGLELNDPYRVSSVQDAINLLQANTLSPLLRGMLEIYYAGGRDIYLVASAPMEEYIENLDDRVIANPEWDNKTFYELYYDRLLVTYSILEDFDAADVVVALEAPFHDAGGVDFLAPLLDFCQSFYEITGKIILGLIGTRGTLNDEKVTALLSDSRLSSIGSNGKFVTVIIGDGQISNKEIPFSYSASVVTSIAGLLSQLRLDQGFLYYSIPNIVGLIGKDLTKSQIEALSNTKLNPVIRNIRGRRGTPYNVVVATDNTLATDGSDFWSLLQMRLVTKVTEKVRTIGLHYIGSSSYFDFKLNVENYFLELVRTGQIRDFQLLIQRDKINPLRATVDVSMRPYFGIREVFAFVAVGPSSTLGEVR